MTRLEMLKAEKEMIKGMKVLSFGLIDKCLEWYDREIEAIEIYKAPNKEYDDPVLEHYKKLAEYYDKKGERLNETD